MRYLSPFLWFCTLMTAWADVTIDDSINDVYYRGAAELVGTTTHSLESDEYHAASKETPLFVAIRFSGNAFLATTRVDLTSDDDALSEPINLALRLSGGDGAYRIAADVDAVQIVRWVAGEDSIWLRVQQSSSTWISGPEGLQAPTEELRVDYTLGTWSNYCLAYPSYRINVTGNARNNSSLTIDTTICLDLSNSTLTAEGGLQSYQPYWVNGFLADAETAPGVFAPGTDAGIDFTGTFDIARGKDNILSLTQTDDIPVINGLLGLEEPGSWQVIQGRFGLLLSTGENGANSIVGVMRYGTQIHLMVPEGLEMGIKDARFIGGEGGFEGSEPVGESAFKNGTLTWYGEPRTNVVAMTVELDLELPDTTPAGALSVNWQMDLQYSSLLLRNSQNPVCTATRALPSQNQVVAHLKSGPMLGHLPRVNGDFSGKVMLVNETNESQTTALHCYDEAGQWLSRTQVTQPAGAMYETTLGEGIPAETAYIRKTAESPVSMSVSYTARGADKGPAQLPQSGVNSTRWRLYGGNGQLTYDGLAVVNVSGTTTTVSVTQYDAAGTPIQTRQVFTLAPGAKDLYVLGTHFDYEAGASFEISADAPLSLVALRGDWASQFLWQVLPTPID